MTVFYAQPYDISANGFYFENMEEYDSKYAKCKNDFGGQVEEFEIQFIDGETLDAVLFESIGVNQCNVHYFINKIDEWIEYEKHILILAVGECGYDFDISKDDPNKFWMDVYYVETIKELAEQFVENGIYDSIPESLQFYIDYEAIARDLSVEYSETTITGENLVYRCS